MDLEDFLARVQLHTGLPHRDGALRATRSTLAALGDVLLDEELAGVRDALPPVLRADVAARSRARGSSLASFHGHVRRAAHVSLPVAVEHAGVVCRVVAETLPDATRARWARELPPSIAALFVPGAAATVTVNADAGRPAPPASHTLATGRPGSDHPLSEARPERAHRDSVARSDDPHAGTKLSSSHGLSQEREHTSLAEGAPGARRALS